jgi:hypothetical protein
MIMMMSNSNVSSVRAAAVLVASVLALATPARAADPVFPAGSRVGLVPPPDMVASEAFDGFSDPNKDAVIVIAVLPAAAYAQIDKTLDLEALKRQGVNLEKREPMQLSFGKGFLLLGRQTTAKGRFKKWLMAVSASDLTALITVQVPEQDTAYPDRVIRAALATVAVRAKVPEAEELGLLPFSVGDLAGFHIGDFVRGRGLLLRDEPNPEEASKEASSGKIDARLLIAAVPGGPAEPDDRANFARLIFNEIGGVRNVNVTVSEPLRIHGQSGYQTMAEAKDAHTGADVMVVQWLRFGGGGYLQMVGISRADTWTSVLARLRTVRDSVELK